MDKFKQFLAILREALFPTPMSDVESYLKSKGAQTPADVEHWLAEYDREKRLRNRMIAME